MTPLRAVKGMNDVLPDEIGRWQRMERAYARTMSLHGFREVRTPYVEPTPPLRPRHRRGDRRRREGDVLLRPPRRALTLRPEGTAGAARAYIEHGVHGQGAGHALVVRRADVPRRAAAARALPPVLPAGRRDLRRPRARVRRGDDRHARRASSRELRVPGVEVLVNSLGGPRHRAPLPRRAREAPDAARWRRSRRRVAAPPRDQPAAHPRLEGPARPQEAVATRPRCTTSSTPTTARTSTGCARHLDALGTPYTVEPRLVRGLDYYTRTLFEIKGAHDKLGAGSTLVGGGRYDAWSPSSAARSPGDRIRGGARAGCSSRATLEVAPRVVDAFVAPLGAGRSRPALGLARELRRAGVPLRESTRAGSAR